ncbi:MAG: PAS domain-containing protein [Gammaproteobacteria bacterium]|nr:PAS domain-containing protein [Gammaproteobacteria bacterium]
MSKSTREQNDPFSLRIDAETWLKQGTAPSSGDWSVSVDALAMLHRLASAPATAGDALKLLHELQVHQVELDLQRGQLEVNEREMAQALAHYKALYDCAPLGYFVVDLNGQVIEANPAGADLLGIARDALADRAMASLLEPASRPALAGLLEELRDGNAHAACTVQSGTGAPRPLRIIAKVSPGGEAIMMMAFENEGSQGA